MDAISVSSDDSARSSPKRSTASSATSRKNKLQRCSTCGRLGHKSRTCDLGKQHEAHDLRPDPNTVMAAYSLLTLSQPVHSQYTATPQLPWAPRLVQV